VSEVTVEWKGVALLAFFGWCRSGDSLGTFPTRPSFVADFPVPQELRRRHALILSDTNSHHFTGTIIPFSSSTDLTPSCPGPGGSRRLRTLTSLSFHTPRISTGLDFTGFPGESGSREGLAQDALTPCQVGCESCRTDSWTRGVRATDWISNPVTRPRAGRAGHMNIEGLDVGQSVRGLRSAR